MFLPKMGCFGQKTKGKNEKPAKVYEPSLAFVFLAAGFLAADFLAAGFLAAAFFAGAFFAAGFLGAAFFVSVFLAAAFLAGFFAGFSSTAAPGSAMSASTDTGVSVKSAISHMKSTTFSSNSGALI
ncbi:MAG: hypothetical protein VX657_06675 [Pseudomonadota bacterium]|nr:hypothetical protein [Pseudomonadota bacterium]